jgi:hypothetical protein
MALNFPSSPTNGQTHTAEGRTWTWSSTTSSWEAASPVNNQQIANRVYASPNGSTGVPSFRALVAADVPTLNQNTTGTAATITGVYAGTITSSQITTGLGFTPYNATNPSGYTSNVGTVTGVTGTAPIVSSGGATPAISISAATISAAGSMSAADKTKLDGIATGATANTGTVTSVGGTGTVSGLTLTGTVTTSGSLTLGGTLAVTASNFASQTAKTFLAAPNGSAGVPTFRELVNADLPSIISTTLQAYSESKVTNAAATGTVTLDLSTSNVFQNTLTGNTTFAFSNPPANTKVFSFTIITVQDATGGRTITWPASKKFSGGVTPPPTTTANAIDVWSVMTYDGGTSYIVSLSVKDAK